MVIGIAFNTEVLSDNNKNLILKAIWENGPISRADISRLLNISKPAVSKNVRELQDAHIIQEVGRGDNSIGKKSTLLVFNAVKAYVIGVDIGNFKIRVGIADLFGNILVIEEENLNSENDGRKILQLIDKTISFICDKQRVAQERILAICIGIPGVNDEISNKNILTPFIKNWENVNIADYFSQRYDSHVIIRNNINIAALGEYNARNHEEQKCNSMVYVNFGIGIGAGVILNGKLYSGMNNAAGEVGFCCFASPLENSDNTETGCYEQDVSVKFILEKYNNLVPQERQLYLDNNDASILFNRYDDHEIEARQVVEELFENVIKLLISVTAILNIGIIVIGGGLGQRMKAYIPVFEQIISKNVPFKPIIRTANLDVMSGVHGAIGDAISEILVDYRNLLGPPFREHDPNRYANLGQPLAISAKQ